MWPRLEAGSQKPATRLYSAPISTCGSKIARWFDKGGDHSGGQAYMGIRAYSGIDCKRIHAAQIRQMAYPLLRIRIQYNSKRSNTSILGAAGADPGVQLERRLRLLGEEHVGDARAGVAGP